MCSEALNKSGRNIAELRPVLESATVFFIFKLLINNNLKFLLLSNNLILYQYWEITFFNDELLSSCLDTPDDSLSFCLNLDW